MRLVNTIATCCLNTDLNLADINQRLNKTKIIHKYNPSRFSALSIKLSDLKTSALIFRNAKLVILGSKTLENIERTLDVLIHLLKTFGYWNINKSPFKLVNSVYNSSVPFRIDIERFSDSSALINFCPESFAGATYRLREIGCTAVIFYSGKFNLLGIKNEQQAIKANDHLQKLLRQYDQFKRDGEGS